MPLRLLNLGVALIALCCASASAEPARAAQASTLTRFSSEAQLDAYLERIAKLRPPQPSMAAAAPMEAMAPAPSMAAAKAVSPGAASITNNQEAGVDEGDIVKLAGNTLVILRRGRLFTLSLASHGMRPVDEIDAYPPGVDARGDWYDEVLVSGQRVIVIGYSYARGGTQINRFRLDKAGHLRFEDAYQLRSSDYYSSRNYASRLIGHQLVIYSMRPLDDAQRGRNLLPALRRWNGRGAGPDFSPIGSAREVYYSPVIDGRLVSTLHSVVGCDLDATVIACKSTSFLGGGGNVFYVSGKAVYIYSDLYDPDAKRGTPRSAVLYRQPLDGAAPSAIGMQGMPIDQFSFQEDAGEGVLNVMLAAQGRGDAMWASESDRQTGALALARVPLALLGNGGQDLPPAQYRKLAPLKRNGDGSIHRFIGNWLVYGSGSDWGGQGHRTSEVVATPVAGSTMFRFTVPHDTDRIEALGHDAVVIGSDGRNLHFSTLLLGQRAATLGDSFVRTAASAAETRSHGFFFRPSDRDGDGLLGLPVAEPARPVYRQLFDESAAVVYLSRKAGKLAPAGLLRASQKHVRDDHCVASCVDWYGNARPIIIDGRVFALMGYELVEGKMQSGTIRERRRINFSPEPALDAVPARD